MRACRDSCALDSTWSADRGNEGRRDANCTESRRFSVSRRSFQRLPPLPTAGLAQRSCRPSPVSTTAATVGHPLRFGLSAQAPRLLCELCPILIHIRVSTVTSRAAGQRKFLAPPHRLAVFTDYRRRSSGGALFHGALQAPRCKMPPNPPAPVATATIHCLPLYLPLAALIALLHSISSCSECLRVRPPKKSTSTLIVDVIFGQCALDE